MSRVRENPERAFEVFVEVARPPTVNEEPFILQKYPDDYDDQDVLKSIPKFAFPCDQETAAVDHFTFVLTDLESKYRFGFCRHATGAHTCLCIVSSLPWYDIFYKFLNFLAERLNHHDTDDIILLLTHLYKLDLPNQSPGNEVEIVTSDFKEKFGFHVPDSKQLPRIPETRNLTEYYNAVDTSNMMIIFASMLHERRILITSKKLSRLTACVHASAELLYPMHWQHLYIPVLPRHLLEYCGAPMPYLIGIHSTFMEKAKNMDLGDAVILDADDNTIKTEHNDLESLPPEVVHTLKKRLRSQQTEKTRSNLMGDGVSRAFLRALVYLIGGYREGLKLRDGETKFVFDKEQFIQSQPTSMQPFLEQMMQLQLFEQFVENRMDKIQHNMADEFEQECMRATDRPSGPSTYNDLVAQMKKQTKKKKVPTATLR